MFGFLLIASSGNDGNPTIGLSFDFNMIVFITKFSIFHQEFKVEENLVKVFELKQVHCNTVIKLSHIF